MFEYIYITIIAVIVLSLGFLPLLFCKVDSNLQKMFQGNSSLTTVRHVLAGLCLLVLFGATYLSATFDFKALDKAVKVNENTSNK